MTTFLTQNIFENLPDWVLSAAIDAEGDLQLFGCKIVHLNPDILKPCKTIQEYYAYE